MRNAARAGVQRAAALAGNRLRINATLIPTGGAAVGIQVANGGAACGILAIGQGVHRVAGTDSLSSAGKAVGGGKIDAVRVPGGIAARWVDRADSFAATCIAAGGGRVRCVATGCGASAGLTCDGCLVCAGLVPHHVAATGVNTAYGVAAVGV